MFGLQEILIIVGVILGLIFIPRMTARNQPDRPPSPKFRLSGKTRGAIAVSFIYLALATAYFQPWRGHLLTFTYAGLGPVILGWLIYWVFVGFKKE